MPVAGLFPSKRYGLTNLTVGSFAARMTLCSFENHHRVFSKQRER
jgi:hypothetical protein